MFPAAKRIPLPSWLLALWIIVAAWTFLPDTAKNRVWEKFSYSLTTSLQKSAPTTVNQQDKSNLFRQIASEQTYPVNYTDPDGRFGKAAWKSTVGNPRVQSGLMAVGGIGEAALGAGLLAVPEPTLLTKVGGVALLGHGADMTTAGLKQMWTGQSAQTFTSRGVSGGLQGVGVNPSYANLAGGLTEIGAAALPIGVAGKMGAFGKQLTTPSIYFGSKTAKEVSEAMTKKFGAPKSMREGAETFYNPNTQRSFNIHTDPAHGPPHVDIRRRGGYPERKYPLAGGEL